VSVGLELLRLIAVTAGFAAIGIVAMILGANIVQRLDPFDDGPGIGSPQEFVLIAMAAMIGIGLVATHRDSPAQLLVAGITVYAVIGAVYCDVARGIVPDFFTLLPLGFLIVFALTQAHYGLLIAAFVPPIPFAIAALFSRGRGMGWGDVKLVALGGAVLGLETAVAAFIAACILAVLVAVWRRALKEPIPFAPYLAGSIAITLAAGLQV
jgi:prepilin signal peptidase PulO-like enzyme (type II secretory pathway)